MGVVPPRLVKELQRTLTFLTLKTSDTKAQGQRSGLPVGRQAQPRSATLGIGSKTGSTDPVRVAQILVEPLQGSSSLCPNHQPRVRCSTLGSGVEPLRGSTIESQADLCITTGVNHPQPYAFAASRLFNLPPGGPDNLFVWPAQPHEAVFGWSL